MKLAEKREGLRKERELTPEELKQSIIETINIKAQDNQIAMDLTLARIELFRSSLSSLKSGMSPLDPEKEVELMEAAQQKLDRIIGKLEVESANIQKLIDEVNGEIKYEQDCEDPDCCATCGNDLYFIAGDQALEADHTLCFFDG